MRTKSPEQHEAEYRWLKPEEVAERIGVDTADAVRHLIRTGHLDAIDVSRGNRVRLRVSPASVDAYLARRGLIPRPPTLAEVMAVEGRVYLIETAEGPHRVKVGFTTDLDGRFHALQHASPVRLRVRGYCIRRYDPADPKARVLTRPRRRAETARPGACRARSPGLRRR